MKNLIVLLLLCVFCFGISLCESGDNPQNDDVIDSNSVVDANFVPDLMDMIPNAYLFEDFNDVFFLNWNILGDDPENWSLGTVPGALTITTQDGSFFRNKKDYKNIFLIDFPLSHSVDFQLTTCVTNFKPRGFWNQAGLILWIDEDNHFKFVYEFGEGPPPNNAPKLLFTAAVEFNGFTLHGWFKADKEPPDIWLRIIKREGFYELFNSTDGITFKPMTVIEPARLTEDNTVPCLQRPLQYIGIFADNGPSIGAPEVEASFDFFEFTVFTKEEETEDE